MKLPNTTSGFIWHFIKQQRAAFIFIMLTSWIWAVNESLFPYFIKRIVNTLHDYQGDPLKIGAVLMMPLGLLAGLWLLMELSMRLQGLVMMKTFPRLRAHIRETVFNYVRRHSHDYFANHFAGNVANKISDLPASSERILEMLIFNFISLSVAFTLTQIVLWHANPIFSLAMMTWASIHMLISWRFLKTGYQLAVTHSESSSTVSGKIVDSLSNISNVHLFAAGEYEDNYLSKYAGEEKENYTRALWHLEKMKIFLGAAGTLFVFSMIFILVYGWAHGWITLGDFTLVGMSTFTMLGFIWFISYQLTSFVREIGKMDAALVLISTPHEVKDASNARPLSVKTGEIQFKNVNFSYKKGKPIFENLSVTIPAGQRVGLVGFSGSGKSTFVNLILRLYDIQSGAILIDEQNIAKTTLHSLQRQIAMIPQDPSLFHRTLMENIRYGMENATDEAVINASKLAHCDEFIEQLDEKYQSLVGERGVKLSGGQRQRIAIARAILKNAPILILDEATSSLDSVTEKIIQKSLDELMKNRTTIVIAHRLSTLSHLDRILVFHQGKIVEDGTTPELLQKNGHFAHLWNMQADGFLPDSEQ